VAFAALIGIAVAAWSLAARRVEQTTLSAG
jgi:hypothetical protein